MAQGVDAVTIDTAHGHSAGVVKAIERIKGGWPELPVVAGNVVTAEGVDTLADAGADAVKVGVGAGSICTTRVISGAGMPQLSAIWTAARRARRRDVPVIADGGITYSGDIVKAIAAGAETVMLGSLLAGTEESPGEMELFEGRRYKSYRGHGLARRDAGPRRRSLRHRPDVGRPAAATGTGTRKLVPEGIEGRVPYAGPLGEVAYQLVGGLRSGMGYAGAATLDALRSGATFMRVTTAGREESHPHDVTITNEAPELPTQLNRSAVGNRRRATPSVTAAMLRTTLPLAPRRPRRRRSDHRHGHRRHRPGGGRMRTAGSGPNSDSPPPTTDRRRRPTGGARSMPRRTTATTESSIGRRRAPTSRWPSPPSRRAAA